MPARSEKSSAAQVMMQAIAHPTDANVEGALKHAELQSALTGLTRDDFKSLADVIGPYVLLRNALQSRDAKDLLAANADPRVGSILMKLDSADMQVLHNIFGGDRVRVPCT